MGLSALDMNLHYVRDLFTIILFKSSHQSAQYYEERYDRFKTFGNRRYRNLLNILSPKNVKRWYLRKVVSSMRNRV